MTESTTLALALLVLGWAIVSGALARHNLTGPLVFAVAGYLLANPNWGPLDIHVDAPSVHVVAEVTLALVLFSDASRVNVTELRRDVWLPARLLAIGLPLSIALGSLLAAVFFDVPWALAGFIGAALAPTDAALSAQVIDDERIPLRLRRVLNVESGLNDGIATPIVTFMLAVAASQIGVDRHSASYDAGQALRELGGGVAVGLIVGFAGAALLVIASRHRWIAPGGHRLASLAVAIASLGAALAIDSNGFIAAFVAGITFGAWLNRNEHAPKEVGELPALGGELLALVVWFLFGATLVHVAFDVLDVPLVDLCGCKPHHHPRAPGRTVLGPRRARSAQRRVHRLVRTERPRVNCLRPSRRRGARPHLARRPNGRRRSLTHGAAQCRPPRRQRGSLWASLRSDRGPKGKVLAFTWRNSALPLSQAPGPTRMSGASRRPAGPWGPKRDEDCAHTRQILRHHGGSNTPAGAGCRRFRGA